MTPYILRWIATTLALALGTACTRYVRRDASAIEVVATTEAHRLRVWSAGETFELRFPRIVGDSLVGWGPTTFGRMEGDRIAVSLDAVDSVATEEWDPGRTGLAITGGGLFWYLTMLVVTPDT